ncbi:MAG: LysR family transcriptional regulator [Cyanobacteria bacterium NC_groundwater_1444_Ag_S-0.65um_54_12]|nr:LysR family transcriptional regulator [Cyanobacteria bacterium NC_groundwater_1444_Ag_S-0.65um_54_12]
MDIEQLQTFAVAADLLSFTRASKSRQLSQPAVSLQIRDLEEHFGIALFERNGRQLSLTPAGMRLREYVGRILAETVAAQDELRSMAGQAAGGILHLGATDTIGNYLLPRLLGIFRAQAPAVRTSIRIGLATEIARILAEREIDCGLIEQDLSPRNAKDLELVPFADDSVVLVVSADHPWSERSEIQPSELFSAALLTRQPGSPMRALIFQHLAAAGIDPEQLDIQMQLTHTETLKQAIKAGLGVGFVSAYAVAEELAARTLRTVQIQGVNIHRRLWLALPAAGFIPERVRVFHRFLLESPALGSVLTRQG